MKKHFGNLEQHKPHTLPKKDYFFRNILNSIVLPGRAKSMGITAEMRATIYQ